MEEILYVNESLKLQVWGTFCALVINDSYHLHCMLTCTDITSLPFWTIPSYEHTIVIYIIIFQSSTRHLFILITAVISDYFKTQHIFFSKTLSLHLPGVGIFFCYQLAWKAPGSTQPLKTLLQLEASMIHPNTHNPDPSLLEHKGYLINSSGNRRLSVNF